MEARVLSRKALDSRSQGREFEPLENPCVISLSKAIYLNLGRKLHREWQRTL